VGDREGGFGVEKSVSADFEALRKHWSPGFGSGSSEARRDDVRVRVAIRGLVR
jgi:hypothetical protein